MPTSSCGDCPCALVPLILIPGKIDGWYWIHPLSRRLYPPRLLPSCEYPFVV